MKSGNNSAIIQVLQLKEDQLKKKQNTERGGV